MTPFAISLLNNQIGTCSQNTSTWKHA